MTLRRTLAIALLAVAAVSLTACGPSPEETECTASGGTWVSERDGTTMIWSGKAPILVPRYKHHCEPA